ncbi:InlB B-repeat-containing protein [Flavobacterium pectinovorum]|uniref:InlB B-repeat-containing protein n=1 Tax=Flavobacterium pectinovorum TaxID=29533 RepID=UPI001FABEF31|nr:right-handed parallel beta-helix repeat-containing protein [Flavobacterium pectinovorum]MCI9844822.1 right-handed parallel beta-helix repeat-containing protein [Flavobacterium pectinovorum]
MKKELTYLFFIILLLPLWINAQIYVSPAGKETNSGAIDTPTTIQNAIKIVTPGQTIFMRGGIYSIASTIFITRENSGIAGKLKRIEAYADETPILDFSSQREINENKGIVLDGFYWYFKGITIRKAGDNGILLSGNSNTIDNCIFEKNRDSGLQISRYYAAYNSISQWPSNNLILNCESFDNKDSLAENADGFAAKLTCGQGNIFRGCISHNNSDDGWDLYTKKKTGPIGAILFENCVAYNNGTLTNGSTTVTGDKNGFKLGGEGIPVNHILRRCIAFGNGQHGFTDNNNLGAIEMTNNTSYNNKSNGFGFREGGKHQFRNNISYKSFKDKNFGKDVENSNVWWIKGSTNGRTPALVISDDDFVSLTVPAVLKNEDGSPNLGDFLALKSNSDFIDAGVQTTGIEFNGTAPDLGARELGSQQKTDFVLKAIAKPIAGGSVSVSPVKATYDAGDVITLTVIPSPDYIFKSWSNGETTATTIVKMDANKTISATFKSTLPAAYVLTTLANPIEGGEIIVNPNKATYSEGEIVTLTAVPSKGNELKSWNSGESTDVVTIAMTADTGVTATFGEKLIGKHTLRIEEAAPGFCTYDGVIVINSSADNKKVTNITDASGSGINYTVKVPVSGLYTVLFRYVHRGKTTSAKVKINAADTIEVSFPVTSSTTKFATTESSTVRLNKGVNTIRLETIDALPFANIDWVEITGEAPVADSCP